MPAGQRDPAIVIEDDPVDPFGRTVGSEVQSFFPGDARNSFKLPSGSDTLFCVRNGDAFPRQAWIFFSCNFIADTTIKERKDKKTPGAMTIILECAVPRAAETVPCRR